MTDSMVERVARAMAENAGFCWENCAQSQWRSDAKAGIAAMREPTDEMEKAFFSWMDQWGGVRWPRAYDAMIDAALETPNGPPETA